MTHRQTQVSLYSSGSTARLRLRGDFWTWSAKCLPFCKCVDTQTHKFHCTAGVARPDWVETFECERHQPTPSSSWWKPLKTAASVARSDIALRLKFACQQIQVGKTIFSFQLWWCPIDQISNHLVKSVKKSLFFAWTKESIGQLFYLIFFGKFDPFGVTPIWTGQFADSIARGA